MRLDEECLETGFLVADLGPLNLAGPFEIFGLKTRVDKLDQKNDCGMAFNSH